MSLRSTTDHIDDYGREHLFEIYDEQWGGAVTALKNTGQGFASFSHQVLDPKNPKPIQKGALELSVWLTDTDLLDDIKGGDEKQFYIIHKVDSVQEWQGYIYNDLTTYEENVLPFRVTLMAKDFTDMGGKDYLVSAALPNDRETVITTICYLLNEVGFDIPVKTHTSWIQQDITAANDYLRQIYHETRALRSFGGEGEDDQAISVEDALTKLCVNHRLILKQTGGAYWIDQLTAYDDPTDVLEAVYDIDGTFSSESQVNTTVAANSSTLKVVISPDNRDNSGTPGVKRAITPFEHRSKLDGISFPDLFVLGDSETRVFSQTFFSDGTQAIRFSRAVTGKVIEGTSEGGRARYRLRLEKTNGDFYDWDNANGGWGALNSSILNIVAAYGKLTEDGDDYFDFFVGANTTPTPADADGEIILTFFNGDTDDTGVQFDETRFTFGSPFQIINSVAGAGDSTSIEYKLTQDGSYSVVDTSEPIWYGDGPTDYAVSALRHGSGDADLTDSNWQRRGSTNWRGFGENHTKEAMDTRRGWRRLLSALLKGVYYPYQVLSYDSQYLYYLGGRWDIFTGNWTADLFQLDIATASDTFSTFFLTSSPSGATGGGSSSGGGGGVDPSLFLLKSSNLSDLASLSTALTNLGLTDASTSLDLLSLDINGTEVIDSSRNASFVGGTFTGELDVRAGINFSASIGLSSTSSPTILQHNNNLWIQGGGDLVGILKSNGFGTPFFYDEPNTLFAFIEPVVIGGSALSGSETLRVAGVTLFDGNEIYSSTTHGITADTSDGSDNKRWFVSGGGAGSTTRGAVLQVVGNQFGSGLGGAIVADIGQEGDGRFFDIRVGGNSKAKLDSSGVFNITDADITTAQIQTLRTHLFKKDITRSVGGRLLVNDVSQVTYIDTGASSVDVEDASFFSDGDWIVISGETSGGFHNVQCQVNGAPSGNTITLDNFQSGTINDVAIGDEFVKISGTSIFMNGQDGSAGAYIEGYDQISSFASSPFGNSPDPTWRFGAMAGFDAGITGDQGQAFKDSSGNLQMYITEDELKVIGGYSSGSYTGVQSGSGTTKAFFAGADDADGLNASAYITAEGDIYYAGMVRNLYVALSKASFASNNEASAINNEYTNQASSTGSLAVQNRTKVRFGYTRRQNENHILFTGTIRREFQLNSGTTEEIEVKAILYIGGIQRGEYEVTSNNTDVDFTIEAEIPSGMDVGELQEIKINLSVTADVSSGGSLDVQGYMHERMSIDAVSIV